MQVSGRTQAIWWGAAALILMLALWGLGQAILPFIIGAGVAYLLDPLADMLERAGLSRAASVVLITITAALGFAAFVLFVAPLVLDQATQMTNALPEMIQQSQGFLSRHFPGLLPEGGMIPSRLNAVAAMAAERGGVMLSSLLGSVASVVSVIALLFIVPVVAFYMLLDWDRMVARVDALLPRQHAPTIRRLASEVDETLSGFVRGQGTVMLILGTFYSIGLMAVKLPYGLAIGVMAAVLSFIPYVGVVVGGATAIGVALFHFWGQPVWIGAVVAIFAAGQIVEGNYLQPKIVGNYVGLHPVWLLLALSVFASLFGFVGMMVAVPLAAALGVLVRFAAERYMASPLFTGQSAPPVPPPPTRVELVTPGIPDALRLATRPSAAHDGADSGNLGDTHPDPDRNGP